MSDPEDLIGEQLAYYRAGAEEYEAGNAEMLRAGGGAWGRLVRQNHREQLAALADFAPRGRVLEIAGGTGIWTRQLVEYADHLTVIDASPESLAVSRRELGDDAARAIEWVGADIFTWRPPPAHFDIVFFSYWLSHVPPSRFEPFWGLVASALAVDGRVFLIDSSADSSARQAAVADPDQRFHVERDLLDDGISLRRLDDGRRFRVVKVVWSPEELVDRLARLGWSATARQTSSGSILATASRTDGR